MSEHVEELAELYAAGALDERDRSMVESHASTCRDCAARIAQASEVVAAIEASRPQQTPSRALEQRMRESVPRRAPHVHWWSAGIAAAAAFAIAFLPAWLAVDRTQRLSNAMSADQTALSRIASSPAFGKASFVSSAGRPLAAKVLYGMRGDWYYVVVSNPRPRMQVAYVHGASMEMLGTVAMHGSSGTLYLPIRHRMDELALLEGGRVVADAHLVY